MDLRNLSSLIGNYISLPQRCIVCIFGFLAIINAFVMRHSIDMVVLPIGNSRKEKSLPEKPQILKSLKERLHFTRNCNNQLHQRKWRWRKDNCPEKSLTIQPISDMWSGQMRTAVMLSFYLGYVITHISGEIWAARYGGKWVLAIALAVTALLTLITPSVINYYGSKGLLLMRLLMGLSEGPIYPALSCMMSQWIPAQERGALVAMVLSASHIGILIMNLLSGVLLPYIEWGIVFYFFGACTLLWFICFISLCFNDPESNPFIKESEKLYLQQSNQSSINIPDTSRSWRQILTDPPMWALISATINHDWSQSIIVSEIRSVMSELKDSNFWDNFWSCMRVLVPFFLNWLVSVLSGILSDIFINQDILNTTEARKLMTLIAAFGPKICSGFTACLLCNDRNDLETVLNCAMAVMGTYTSIELTSLDMIPNYAATQMAIANGMGSLTNIAAPYLELLTKESDFSYNMADTSGYISKPQPEWGIAISKYFIIPQRVIMAIMGFLAIVNAYTMRICLSMVMPALVLPRNYTDKEAMETHCPKSEDAFENDEKIVGGDFDWSQSTQGFILCSFYIGYLLTHIPGGELAKIYGAKWVLSLGILSTAIFTLITPSIIEKTGYYGLVISRILMGCGEGTTFPALSALIAQWVPTNERGKIGALILGGGQVGSIVGNFLSGFILDSYGWHWVFYIFGLLAVLWFILFTFLCYSDPASHPFIKPSEKEYLIKEMGFISRRRDLGASPWKDILTSVPMYALISAQIGHDWAFYIMVTDMPKYLNDVMQVPIKKNAVYSSLPYLLMWILSMLSGFLADFLIKHQYMSLTLVRKVMTGVAAFGPAIFALLASYSGCNEIWVVMHFTLCLGLMGAYYAGMKLTPIDMSPNYAGTLMAITNGIGSITGVLAPFSVGLMTPNTTIQEWRLVFWLAAFILSITAVIYCIWATGEIQPWNEPKKTKTSKNEME